MTSILLSCEGHLGIGLKSLQWNWASFRVEGVSRGFSRVAAGRSGFLSSCDRDLGQHLGLQKGSKKLLSSYLGELRIAFEWLHVNHAPYWDEQESCGFSRVVVGSLGFLFSCDSELGETLELQKGSGPSYKVTRGNSGLFSSRCSGIGLILG